jgi:gluconolactonase
LFKEAQIMEPALTELASGLEFPEGPIYLADGSLIIVEIAAGCVSRIMPNGRKHIVAKPGGGPNGAALGPDGLLYICNSGGFAWERRKGLLTPVLQAEDYSGGRIERVNIDTGKVEVIYDSCDGHPLKGPNDLVFDAHGGFYFTDLGKWRHRDLDCGGLFYAHADGSLIQEVVYPLTTPNGVGLSPGGAEVYVAETDTGRLWAFAIVTPGVVDRVEPLGGRYLNGPPGFTSFDSLAVEADGNICVASLVYGGITVVASDGRFVEFVPMPDPLCTNICFGGAELQTAYITLSGTGRLVSLPWARKGLALNYLQYSSPRKRHR